MLVKCFSLLMLSALNCRFVVAPDASGDKRDSDDNIAHIGAVQGTHIN